MRQRIPKVFFYEDKRGEYRWQLVATNGRILADSGEGYRHLSQCRYAFQRVCDLGLEARYYRRHPSGVVCPL
jgi:uncharacterized protein YegP (UPF0339 family)